MTNKEKFANMYNLSDFAKNNPKFSIILAIIFILLFPFIYTVTQSYRALKEARIFKYFMYDWKRLIKMPKILIEYINCK